LGYGKLIGIVLDGVGLGPLPDVAAWSNAGLNTIASMARAVGALNLPNLQKFGLGTFAADHGNDPTDSRADLSREYMPLLWYDPSGRKNVNLGTGQSFAKVGKTLATYSPGFVLSVRSKGFLKNRSIESISVQHRSYFDRTAVTNRWFCTSKTEARHDLG
jgi:phosphopentomutase